MVNCRLLFMISPLCLLSTCQKLPVKRLSQWEQKIEAEVENDSLSIIFNNPLQCPLRISAKSSDESIQKKIDRHFPVTMAPAKDTVFTYFTSKSQEELDMKFSATIGSTNDSVRIKTINLPFYKGHKYKIIQGYNGSYSHHSEYSKCAIDFNLAVGDTICAVADGFVVGVIEGYSQGGKSKKWRDYANFITVFHPEMNIYTQYVHLTYMGSLVEVGDFVKSEQAIALSGKTGHTDIEHLHFNVLKPNQSGMESIEIEFIEGYKGIDLKRGDWVEK